MPRDFYPRPPRGGRPIKLDVVSSQDTNFYPRPPRGGRPGQERFSRPRGGYFYPRPPRGGRLINLVSSKSLAKFLSTPSARRATHSTRRQLLTKYISIHALREEGDSRPLMAVTTTYDFYPRPPRGGRPSSSGIVSGLPDDFYPRPPRGGRP